MPPDEAKHEDWEVNLIADFLIHLLHRKILQEENSSFKLIRKSIVIREFQNNFINAEIRQKLLETITTDKMDTLLKHSGFLIPVSDEDIYYNMKHSLVMEYRAKKFEELDIVRINPNTKKTDNIALNNNIIKQKVFRSYYSGLIFTDTFKVTCEVAEYYPSEEIVNCLDAHYFPGAIMKVSEAFAKYLRNNKTLDESIYCQCLKVALQIEDAGTLNEFKKLNLYDIELNRYMGDGDSDYSFVFKLGSQKELFKNLISVNDSVYLKENDITKPRKYCATITNIHNDRVTFKGPHGDLPISVGPKFLYNLEFVPSRFEIRHQYRALDLLATHMPILKKFLFPINVQPQSEPPALLNLQLFNESVGHNPEQVQAVSNIVQGPRNDATYIIFGPPGTGKTTTIVEAILQILKKNCANKVLVTAQTNAACDEVALRLCKYINTMEKPYEIIRLFARSQEKNIDEMSSLLLNISNMCHGYSLPSIHVISRFRIIVCTLALVGKLTTGGFGEGFSHVFIDEAASCTETQALLGIVGIVNKRNNLIIAGDHKQLGPHLKSTQSEKLGFNKSLMERLMEYKCYQVDTVTGNYDRSIQIRLRLNFRSHPEIVKVFNRLFYNESLEASAKAADHHLVNKWYKFPNNNYPIIFHSVKGNCQRDKYSTSLYNLTEVDVVMHYLKELMHFGIDGVPIEESDIGIISPYKRQCKYIEDEINCRNWFKITVGTVEILQGQEKKIIIVSFVRTGTSSLGFLTDPRRLNVTISRPKSLLILIGDDVTLGKNPLYADIIETCRANGTLVDSNIPSKDIGSINLMEGMKNLNINS